MHDSLSLIAELSVALVAAAGIVTAIGGRDREYTALDRVTIRGLVVVAATPLGIALLGLIALSAGVPTARICSGLSFAYVLVIVIRYALTVPESIRIRVQDPTLPRRGLIVSTGLGIGVALLLLYNAIVLTSLWAVLAACAYELLCAVWLVLRLLLGTSLGSR